MKLCSCDADRIKKEINIDIYNKSKEKRLFTKLVTSYSKCRKITPEECKNEFI